MITVAMDEDNFCNRLSVWLEYGQLVFGGDGGGGDQQARTWYGPNLMGAFNYFDHDDGVSDIDGVVIIVVVVIVKVEPLGCWIIS